MISTDKIKVFFNGTHSTWGYRVEGTDLQDKGYGSAHDAFESAMERLKLREIVVNG